MNNSKMIKQLNKLVRDSFDYWKDITEEYNIHEVSFTLYDECYRSEDVDYIASDCDSNRMVTLLTPKTGDESGIESIDRIIEYIEGSVYMSYQRLFEILIDCELDFSKVLETMKFTLKHELGHIIAKQRFVGESIKYWNDQCDAENEDYKNFPKLRKNASVKNRLKWLLSYNELPEERAANNAVGITKDDIIADFNRLICK